MRLLLTSGGISNTSIHDALVDLLGKPIAESSALCIPTAIYAKRGGAGLAWRFISGRDWHCPMSELGWKSLGVLVSLVQASDVLPVGGRRSAVSVLLDAAVRIGEALAVAASRDGLRRTERRQHGDGPQRRGGIRRLASALRRR
jgi:hypothetical protein